MLMFDMKSYHIHTCMSPVINIHVIIISNFFDAHLGGGKQLTLPFCQNGDVAIISLLLYMVTLSAASKLGYV